METGVRRAWLGLAWWALTAGLAQAQQFGANDAPFLNFVGHLEAPAGFSDVVGQAAFFPESPIEEKTIAQVLAYQEALRAAGSPSTAVGRYQFIYATLSGLVARLELDKNRIFDSEMQTFLARHLMWECGFYDPQEPVAAIGNCLAGHWAALPMITGPQAGRSRYEGEAGNRALTAPAMVVALLEERFLW
jgi:hypothetical protein